MVTALLRRFGYANDRAVGRHYAFVHRLSWMVLVLALVGSTADAFAQAGPFAGQYNPLGVTASRDGSRIWLTWSARGFSLAPESLEPVGRSAFPEWHPVSPVWISFECRLPTRSPWLAADSRFAVYLSAPLHPAVPDAYTVFHPLYWVLGVFGNDAVTVPLVLHTGTGHRFDVDVVRRRTAYGNPRPQLRVDLPSRFFVDRLLAREWLDLLLEGSELSGTVAFSPLHPELVPAARLLGRHCSE